MCTLVYVHHNEHSTETDMQLNKLKKKKSGKKFIV